MLPQRVLPGMMLVLNVGAMLIAFVALIALINGILSGIGDWFNAGLIFGGDFRLDFLNRWLG